MSPLDLLLHILNFIAPALFVAACVVWIAPKVLGTSRPKSSFRRHWLITSSVGIAVLAVGLWFFGVDGKMATYGVLVLAVAGTQWWLLKP